MNNIDLDRVNHLVMDLLVEFEKEASKLRADYDNSSMRIREIDENIYNYRENEDVDIQVFSPRKVDNRNEARLDNLNKEKDEVQSSVKDISRQMKYYNDKIEKLKEIKSILNSEQYEPAPDDTDSDDNSSGYDFEKIFNIDEKIKRSSAIDISFKDDADSADKKKNMPGEKSSDNFDSADSIDGDAGDEIDLQNMDSSSLINNLVRISHRADVGYKIIDNDTFRAKMEFKSIKSNLEDVINSLK